MSFFYLPIQESTVYRIALDCFNIYPVQRMSKLYPVETTLFPTFIWNKKVVEEVILFVILKEMAKGVYRLNQIICATD